MNRAIISVLILASIMIFGACSPTPPDNVPLGAFDYPAQKSPSCAPGARLAEAGRSNNEKLAVGHKYSVRTPLNYDPTYQHPLIVVYSAARQHRFRTEAVTGLTTLATQAGFITSYVDSLRLDVSNIELLSEVPIQIAKKWCIDDTRIYLTGHSDGGTVANAIAFLPNMPFRPKAIAPSAAGIRGADMVDRACPANVSVMTWQNTEDELFPGYGHELAAWWAKCNRCDMNTQAASGKCAAFMNCSKDAEITICDNVGTHRDWPKANHEIVEFFIRN